MKLTKTHTLELKVVDFKKKTESIEVAIEVTKDSDPLYINSILIDRFYIRGFSVLDDHYHKDLFLESGKEIDLYDCGESELLIGLFGYNFESGIQEYIYSVVKEYLVEHKLPCYYKQEIEDECGMEFLAYDITDELENNIFSGTYGNEINTKVEWRLDNYNLHLYNIHLNKMYKLKSYSEEEIEGVILNFNKEWNSIINGKFIWE